MVGNVGINVIGYGVAHLPGIAKGLGGATVGWTPAATATLLTELCAIALLIASAFFFQSRKTDFL